MFKVRMDADFATPFLIRRSPKSPDFGRRRESSDSFCVAHEVRVAYGDPMYGRMIYLRQGNRPGVMVNKFGLERVKSK